MKEFKVRKELTASVGLERTVACIDGNRDGADRGYGCFESFFIFGHVNVTRQCSGHPSRVEFAGGVLEINRGGGYVSKNQ